MDNAELLLHFRNHEEAHPPLPPTTTTSKALHGHDYPYANTKYTSPAGNADRAAAAMTQPASHRSPDRGSRHFFHSLHAADNHPSSSSRSEGGGDAKAKGGSSPKGGNTDEDKANGPSGASSCAPSEGGDSAGQGCNCKKSRCLKLYCQCFAVQQMCGPSCNCIGCMNVPAHDKARQDAIRAITDRNPNAFQTKFRPSTGLAKGKGEEDPSTVMVHKVGCKCRKSACLKKYCECFNAGAKCSDKCICKGCQNQQGGAITNRTKMAELDRHSLPLLAPAPPYDTPQLDYASARGLMNKSSSASSNNNKKRRGLVPSRDGHGGRDLEDDTDMLQAAEDLALLKSGPAKRASAFDVLGKDRYVGMGEGYWPSSERGNPGHDRGGDASNSNSNGRGYSPTKVYEAKYQAWLTSGGGMTASHSSAFIRPSILRSKMNQKRTHTDAFTPPPEREGYQEEMRDEDDDEEEEEEEGGGRNGGYADDVREATRRFKAIAPRGSESGEEGHEGHPQRRR